MINISEVKEKTGTGKSYMRPGINDVEIVSFSKEQAKTNGNDIIIGTFVNVHTGDVHEEHFPASQEVRPGKEKSPFDLTLIKLRHIARAAIGEANLENLDGASTIQEFVDLLNTNLVGATYRQKFTGEQKKSAQGNLYDIARIGLPGKGGDMAESLTVSRDKTTLVYDKSNSNDYKPYVEVGLGMNNFNIPTPEVSPFKD